ncbi:MAG: virulence factor [Myxococcota bacterium]
MYAVAFDLVVVETKKHHPKGDPSAAYREIYEVLVGRHGFEWKQGSLYTLDDEDMARLFAAIMDLRALPWFPASVRDIRAFRVEQWSDFTSIVKGRP